MTYLGIDFSGDARKWSRTVHTRTVWVAKVRQRASVKVDWVRAIQDFPGSETPFQRISMAPQVRGKIGMRMSYLGRGFGLIVTILAYPAVGQPAATLEGMRAYNAGNINTAYRRLKQEAEKGDAEAQVNLGYLYARGQGVKADQREAFRLHALSADQGNGEGMNALGYKYEYAMGVPKDIGKAIHWFCRAIAFGNPRAMNNLALLLHEGREVPADEAEARSLWGQAAALGHSNAMYSLAMSYLWGPETARDPVQGNMWLMKAAEAGNSLARDVLWKTGYKGQLPPANNPAALMIPWVRDAAGHTKVCGNLISWKRARVNPSPNRWQIHPHDLRIAA